MQIKEMFAKKIDHEIQGVIIVGQGEDSNVSQELEEYVVTRELQKHFADFYSAYKKGIVGTTPKMGVWISGFFGSGKSHFLKILSYLLENRQVGSRKALDYFIEDKKIVELVKNKNCIFVYNKVDLIKGKDDDKLYVSAINKDVEKLKEAIINKLGLSQENYDNPSIANTREIGILENIKEILEHVLIDVKAEIPLDLINSELKDAYLKTLSILGEDNDFDIAKEIFSRFCVGK